MPLQISSLHPSGHSPGLVSGSSDECLGGVTQEPGLESGRWRLQAGALLETPEIAHLLSLVRLRMGFPRESFAITVAPVLEHWLATVPIFLTDGQASGQRLVTALHQALRALDRRHERILPPQVAPESLGALAHGWTWAVVISALLLSLRQPKGPTPVELFEASLSVEVRGWLLGLGELMPTLLSVLSGQPAPGNPIAAILREAGVWPAESSVSFADEKAVATTPLIKTKPTDTNADPGRSEETSLPPVEEDWPSGEGGAFYAWVAAQLQAGQLSLNHREALVHRVAEGLLLVSPSLFRRYLAQSVSALAHDPVTDPATKPANDKDRLRRLQREVLKVGWHLRSDGGLNLHAYEWAHGGLSPVHGLVVTRAQRFIQPLPAINGALLPVTPLAGRGDPP